MQALYGHYEKTYHAWQEASIAVPPCFIVVCQNTSISKLVYDFISGFHRTNPDGSISLENGRLPLFRNFDETTGDPHAQPRTLLIDSEQLEAGDALDDNFRTLAADERGGTTPFNLLPISTGGQPGGTEHHPAATPYHVAAWWCRYLLPKGGVLLDPFVGSGSMIVAGLDEGASKVIGIDRESKYLEITRRRVETT
jgi:hypothetical protein